MPLPQSQTKVRKISDVISRFGCLVPANTHISGHVNGMFWSMIDRSLLVINVRIHGHSSSQFVPTAAPGP